jgi:hypothetical protein
MKLRISLFPTMLALLCVSFAGVVSLKSGGLPRAGASASPGLRKQTPAPITITPISPQNYATVSPDSRGLVTFWVKATAPAGLRSVTMMMPDGVTTTTVYPFQGTNLTVRCGWYAKNAPRNQQYQATCTVVDRSYPTSQVKTQPIYVTLK